MHEDYEMPFGKYKGEELQTIWLSDKGYLEWIIKTFDDCDVREKVEEFLEDK